ncbi:ABC transporter permease [Saccharopolyspora taberi]|uniref:ABC transporter permease n=1 Tax=Saccharopolyspora taberi TaxID=60895 RepID=A0ABN3V929_9PSEU
MSSPLMAVGMAECKLLLRNRMVAFSATVLPLAMGVYLGFVRPPDGSWGMFLALQLMVVLGFTVYFTTSTALTSRREDLYLKRLCSAEPGRLVVLSGLLVPVVLLGVVQSAVMLGIAAAFGAPVGGVGLLLVAVAVIGGLVLCLAAGIATSGRTSTPEQAQITTLPFFIVLFGGAVWGSLSSAWHPLLIPGGAVGDLVERALSGELGGAGPALVALVAWVVVAGFAARQWFRWEPRG